MSAHITTIPIEVYDIICRVADARSLKALRRTNHHMHQRTEKAFASRTFSQLVISLTKYDISYLSDVAFHPKYSSIVESICIVPSSTNGDADHRKFCEDGMDIIFLARAIPYFKNLKDIQIGKFRKEQERSNLATHCVPGSNITALAHAFHVLLQVLEDTGTQLEKIRAGFQPYGKRDRNSIDHLSLQLPPPTVVLPRSTKYGLKKSLTSLKEMDLVLEVRGRTSSVHCETYLADLLKQTMTLRRLRLSFPDTCCAWFAGLPSVHLPFLTSLTLKKAHRVCAPELYDFISRHKTLTSLELTLLQFDESDPFKGLAECLKSLRLNEIHLQQLTNLSPYVQLMVFGGDQGKICTACYEDVEAAFFYVEGPGCEHSTISVKGESEINAALQSRMRDCFLLTRLQPGWANRLGCCGQHMCETVLEYNGESVLEVPSVDAIGTGRKDLKSGRSVGPVE